MEIKVLGTGCAGCKALYETTKQAIFELGCDVVLIKEEDLLKIMEYDAGVAYQLNKSAEISLRYALGSFDESTLEDMHTIVGAVKIDF